MINRFLPLSLHARVHNSMHRIDILFQRNHLVVENTKLFVKWIIVHHIPSGNRLASIKFFAENPQFNRQNQNVKLFSLFV